jgi:hypothetical protein
MAEFFRNAGLMVQEYEYDFAVDGGATGVKVLSAKANKAPLPADCIVTNVVTRVVSALAGSGASAKFGTGASDALYAANAAVATYSEDALFEYATNFVADAANERTVLMTIAGGALTAGKVKVLVEYLHHTP